MNDSGKLLLTFDSGIRDRAVNGATRTGMEKNYRVKIIFLHDDISATRIETEKYFEEQGPALLTIAHLLIENYYDDRKLYREL